MDMSSGASGGVLFSYFFIIPAPHGKEYSDFFFFLGGGGGGRGTIETIDNPSIPGSVVTNIMAGPSRHYDRTIKPFKAILASKHCNISLLLQQLTSVDFLIERKYHQSVLR